MAGLFGGGGGFGAGTVNDIAGAASSILTGKATAASDTAQASADFQEAQLYQQEGEFAGISGKLQQAQQERTYMMAAGASQNEIAAGGFANSGSALDIMRSNAQQGGVANATIQENTQVTQYIDTQEAWAATQAGDAAQSAASQASSNGMIIGGIKLAAAAFTLL